MMTFTLSPALISTFAAGLASGVVATGAGVAAAGVLAGLFEFELSVGLDSQAESATDNSAIARVFFIVSSVSLALPRRASQFAGEWRRTAKRFMSYEEIFAVLRTTPCQYSDR